MFSISGYFITGVMFGIEFVGAEDVNDPTVSLSIVIDLAIIRLQLTFYKQDPFKPA